MNYKEVKQELKREFDSYLKPLGFKSKVGQGCSFFKPSDNGYQKIVYGIVNFGTVFYTSASAFVGIDKIDIVMSKIFDYSYKKSIEGGGTLYTSTSIYFDKINYDYRIIYVEDIKRWLDVFKDFYYNHLVWFYSTYNTVSSIDKLLNENPTEKVIYCDDWGWRIIKGLIVAKLNNNPKYNELRDYYKDGVEKEFQGYFMYEKCMKVIDFLDKYTSEELNKLAEK